MFNVISFSKNLFFLVDFLKKVVSYKFDFLEIVKVSFIVMKL